MDRPKVTKLPPYDDGTRFQWYAHDERLRSGPLTNVPVAFHRTFGAGKTVELDFSEALAALYRREEDVE